MALARYASILLGVVMFSGCSGSSKSPSAPSQTTVQVGGVWAITTTVSGTTGGECFASIFQSTVGAGERGT